MKGGTKYGLQLRGPQAASGAAKKTLPPPPKPSIFTQDDDDDEEAVEQAIARHAAKNRALEQVSLLHKAALEQDSTAFAYDEVYDDIKAKSSPSRKADPEQSKPKYITKLLDKAKARQQEQEIIYERKLLKEREREDHLYGDKDKFLTTAYKQKLLEQAKWIEEERLRELREQADEVTKKKDLSDFYHNLLAKNVAFGASKHKVDRTAPQELLQVKQEEPAIGGGHSRDPDLDESSEQDEQVLEVQSDTEKESSEQDEQVLEVQSDKEKASTGDNERGSSERLLRTSPGSVNPEADAGEGSQKSLGKGLATDIPAKAERKPSQDALSAAKERFLARKRMRTT